MKKSNLFFSTVFGVLCICFISAFTSKPNRIVQSENKPIVVYNGVTGYGKWYVCDRSKTTVYEKEKKVITYINKASFDCFGIYFDNLDIHKGSFLTFETGIESNYKEDSVALYISFIDAGKNMTNFKKLKVSVPKGPMKEVKVPLDDIIIKELKVNFFKINSILFYVESKRDHGFWGNVVLKDIQIH
jgi:hypothetical protein